MGVTSVHKDRDALTMTVTAEYEVTPDRAWQLWSDPRQLERWWGPPTYPATVEKHDLTPGGTITYFMTGPEGDRHQGWWEVLEVEAPRLLVVRDGFADADGSPNPDMPTMVMRVTVNDRDGGGVVLTMLSTFPSLEALDQLLAMGMEEGLMAAMSQIDGVLVD
jgi:uncharacterized protein YndB with AHSA1/START domain